MSADPPVSDPPSERDLVDRARTGDQQAAGALYDLYVDRIYRFVLVRSGNATEAEDITAEVFVRVIEALPRFEWKDVPFSAWVFRIAHNQVVSHYRRTSSRPTQAMGEDFDVVDTQALTEQIVEQKLSMGEVYTAMQGLSELQRKVLLLRFSAGLSVKETAANLRKTENNIKVLQNKAITKLRKLLDT